MAIAHRAAPTHNDDGDEVSSGIWKERVWRMRTDGKWLLRKKKENKKNVLETSAGLPEKLNSLASKHTARDAECPTTKRAADALCCVARTSQQRESALEKKRESATTSEAVRCVLRGMTGERDVAGGVMLPRSKRTGRRQLCSTIYIHK